MEKVQKILEHAERHCKTHGSRLTDKRKQVLSGLLQSNKALSAYELIDHCKNEFGERLPAMSVYRILDFLQEEHLVHKLNLANKYIACAHITSDHDHTVPQFLICDNCQKVTEVGFSKTMISQIRQQVRDTGFQLVSPQIELNCLCNDCEAKPQ